jgi:hypothetical protein
MKDLEKKLNHFLGEKPKSIDTSALEEEGFQEVCDKDTGDCYTIKVKDGLIERINRKMMTQDGKTLLMD